MFGNTLRAKIVDRLSNKNNSPKNDSNNDDFQFSQKSFKDSA